jgi:hypothetical protein
MELKEISSKIRALKRATNFTLDRHMEKGSIRWKIGGILLNIGMLRIIKMLDSIMLSSN